MPTLQEVAAGIVANIEKVIVGKRPQIQTVLATLIAQGHVLLEDVPGVAKTMLARSMAVSLGCGFKRVQCTPDLLPTEVTGVSIFNQKTREFEFSRGPVFTNVLLADEINRATPRTQSSLLEAMEERQVSMDGATYLLDRPFFVVATQNPVEQEGTFPLPEVQLDRFLVRVSMGYPGFVEEGEMLERLHGGHPLDTLQSVVNAEAVQRMQDFARRVFVHKQVQDYILKIVHGTRTHLKLALGASPRASIGLYRASQAMAALEGREYVTPDDVKKLAVSVLAHRLILKPEHRLRRETPQSVVEEVVHSIPVPSHGFSSKKTGIWQELDAAPQPAQ